MPHPPRNETGGIAASPFAAKAGEHGIDDNVANKLDRMVGSSAPRHTDFAAFSVAPAAGREKHSAK
jgi:hypothetical protein